MALPTQPPPSYNLFELMLSGAIAVAALAFLAFMQIETGTGRLTSYELTVEMANAGGLKIGTDVRIAGVKIGKITGLSLNTANRHAEVRLALRDDLALPADSVFQVSTGIMSDPYLSVSPGHSGANIPPGSMLRLAPASRRAPKAGV